MKITTSKTPNGFEPFEISITFESEVEVDLFVRVLDYGTNSYCHSMDSSNLDRILTQVKEIAKS